MFKTDYKNDILSESMNGKRKYKMIDNGDGTVSFDDVTVYDQAGDDFGAGDINTINAALNEIEGKKILGTGIIEVSGKVPTSELKYLTLTGEAAVPEGTTKVVCALLEFDSSVFVKLEAPSGNISGEKVTVSATAIASDSVAGQSVQTAFIAFFM